MQTRNLEGVVGKPVPMRVRPRTPILSVWWNADTQVSEACGETRPDASSGMDTKVCLCGEISKRATLKP